MKELANISQSITKVVKIHQANCCEHENRKKKFSAFVLLRWWNGIFRCKMIGLDISKVAKNFFFTLSNTGKNDSSLDRKKSCNRPITFLDSKWAFAKIYSILILLNVVILYQLKYYFSYLKSWNWSIIGKLMLFSWLIFTKRKFQTENLHFFF